MHHLPLAELEKAVLERQRTRPAGIERQVAYHAILYRTSCGLKTASFVEQALPASFSVQILKQLK